MIKRPEPTFIAVILTLILLSLFSLGCSLPFLGGQKKEDDIKKVERLKNEVDTHYTSVQEVSNDMNEFVKVLQKSNYTTGDVEKLASEAKVIRTKLQRSKTEANEVHKKISKIKTLSPAGWYYNYADIKLKASRAQAKANTTDEQILQKLESVLPSLGNLFGFLDELKDDERSLKQILNTTAFNDLIGQRDLDNQRLALYIHYGNLSSEESPPSWAEELQNDPYFPQIIIDFLSQEREKLESLHKDSLRVKKEINFFSASKIESLVSLTKTDVLSFQKTLADLNRKLVEKKRLEIEIDFVSEEIDRLDEEIDIISEEILEKRPSEISSTSFEAEALRDRLDDLRDERDEYQDKLESLIEILADVDESVKELREEDSWRDAWKYAGSVASLIDFNDSSSKELMVEVKQWEENKIESLVKSREGYTKKANKLNLQAEKMYEKYEGKIAEVQVQ